MSRARQAAALLAIGALASLAGFSGAAWLFGSGAPAPASSAALPAALPDEALLEPPPPLSRPRSPRRRLPRRRRRDPPRCRRRRAGRRRPPSPGRSRGRTSFLSPIRSLRPADRAGARARAAAASPSPAAHRPAGRGAGRRRDPRRRGPVGDRAGAAGARRGARIRASGSAEEADVRRSLALWSAYLAPGAAPAPQGRRATVARALRANAWWFAGRASPDGRVLLRDRDGIILTYRRGQGFAVNPVATTGRWRGLNDGVPAEALAASLLEMAVERTADDRRFAAWQYYDVADDDEAIRPGTSGMAQARVALVMAHAHARSGDARFEQAALDAIAAFVVDVERGGARSMVAVEPGQTPGPWYVERACPGESPWKGGALNGFMVTPLNLRGTAAVLERSGYPSPVSATAIALARDLADRGAATLEAPPRRPRLGLVELLRPVDAGPTLAHLPRRPELPLLPRAPAQGTGRAPSGPRVRRDRREVAGLRRARRGLVPGAVRPTRSSIRARSAGRRGARSGATRSRRAASGRRRR